MLKTNAALIFSKSINATGNKKINFPIKKIYYVTEMEAGKVRQHLRQLIVSIYLLLYFYTRNGRNVKDFLPLCDNNLAGCVNYTHCLD